VYSIRRVADAIFSKKQSTHSTQCDMLSRAWAKNGQRMTEKDGNGPACQLVNGGTRTTRQDWNERTNRESNHVIESGSHESNGPIQQRWTTEVLQTSTSSIDRTSR
jgi:hypothetical protein